MDRFTAMEAFVRVADANSFSSAAKQLRIGQPAVSKTIAQLEDRLGVLLLLRSTHRLTPPKRVGTSMNAPREPSEVADEAELAARGAAVALSGRLRFSGPLTFTRLHVTTGWQASAKARAFASFVENQMSINDFGAFGAGSRRD